MDEWDYMDWEEFQELREADQEKIWQMRDSRKQTCHCEDFPCCIHFEEK